jgi:hypothetical protein
MNSHKALEAVAAAAAAANNPFAVAGNGKQSSAEFQDLALHLNSNFAAAAAMQASLMSSHNPATFNNVFNRAVQSRMIMPGHQGFMNNGSGEQASHTQAPPPPPAAFFNPYFSFNGQPQQRLPPSQPELYNQAKSFINSSLHSDPNESLLSTSSSSSSSSSSSYQSSKSKSPMQSPSNSLVQAAIAISPVQKSIELAEGSSSVEVKNNESF